MIPRVLAGLLVISAFIGIAILGPGQFGYPYMGMLAGIATLLQNTSAKSEWLMFVLPLTAIAIMALFGLCSIFTLVVLACRIFTRRPRRFLHWAEFWSPVLLSSTMLVGLGLLRAFPGSQEVPVTFSNGHFVYPLMLAIVAFCIKATEQTLPKSADDSI